MWSKATEPRINDNKRKKSSVAGKLTRHALHLVLPQRTENIQNSHMQNGDNWLQYEGVGVGGNERREAISGRRLTVPLAFGVQTRSLLGLRACDSASQGLTSTALT